MATPHLGQNRIDYIVYHNTDGSAALLEAFGFEAPEDPKDLAETVKELVRKKGRKVLKALLKLHPDADAIVKYGTSTSDACDSCSYDNYNTTENYCKSCGHSNYSGAADAQRFMEQFKAYDDKTLERYYQTRLKASNAQPENQILAQEVQMVWNALRTREQQEVKQEPNSRSAHNATLSITKDDVLLFGAVFIAGLLVGQGLKFNFNNAN